ncbi:hypothetical protein BaRGS_00017882 [Batillaria attramentaria]|uniref:Uncharacterized protein n=1 Tax=Batillaria attramentaria TaxID=370345 RepID=A0ABD0KU83_9CAEN
MRFIQRWDVNFRAIEQIMSPAQEMNVGKNTRCGRSHSETCSHPCWAPHPITTEPVIRRLRCDHHSVQGITGSCPARASRTAPAVLTQFLVVPCPSWSLSARAWTQRPLWDKTVNRGLDTWEGFMGGPASHQICLPTPLLLIRILRTRTRLFLICKGRRVSRRLKAASLWLRHSQAPTHRGIPVTTSQSDTDSSGHHCDYVTVRRRLIAASR